MHHTDKDEKTALNFLLNQCKMNMDEVLDNIESMKNNEILKMHKYAITPLKDGRFATYLPDDSKPNSRRKIVKTTQAQLEKTIIKYYKDIEYENSLERISLETFYQEWFQYKALHTSSSAYMKTIDELWQKYYVSSKIVAIPIVKLDKITLDIWAHTMVSDYDMTKKKYYNTTIIMRQALDLAVEKGIIEKNPFATVKMEPKLFKTVRKKADETQVYLIEEQPQIEQEAYNDFSETNAPACLAIPFAFQTGMRVSELCALKWSDINDEKQNCIHVQRMEIKQYKKLKDASWSSPTRVLVERTKSFAGNRNVYLTSVARSILDTVKQWQTDQGYSESEYIFLSKDGKRIHTPALDTRIRKYCRHAMISEKSMHKIRKTYISTLIDCDYININYIREQVGHEDERTTYGNYCFNRKAIDRTEQDMELALAKKGEQTQ